MGRFIYFPPLLTTIFQNFWLETLFLRFLLFFILIHIRVGFFFPFLILILILILNDHSLLAENVKRKIYGTKQNNLINNLIL